MTAWLADAASEAVVWPAGDEAEPRTAVVVSADAGLRRRLVKSLEGLRWRVREANGGAEAMLCLEERGSEAMLVDCWLPDLEANEFAAQVRLLYPAMEVLRLDGGTPGGTGQDQVRSPRRNELLHAIREARASDGPEAMVALRGAGAYRLAADGSVIDGSLPARVQNAGPEEGLPELIGASEAIREVGRLVRMVAPRSTTVLIEGETGTGKEVVAQALHRLSPRAAKPFAVLNCAAIPESLLEAELFGHTRGAFTGAVQSRMGRIEMANGGTLLLDEIGEMPLTMQAKMLRFLESGELQRVGENEMLHVDVRLIAATHQDLEEQSAAGTFRLDLYHRLAVFPIEVPPLRERREDIAVLVEHFLERLGRESPRKRLGPGALERLREHRWPGNVRELMHVLERAAILAGGNPEIAAADIRYRRSARIGPI
jgi:DNA-binding NtrC family response regulator